MSIERQACFNKEVWIGLIGVKPKTRKNLLGPDIIGAFVNVLAYCQDSKEYKVQVENALNNYGLDLVEMEDVEPFQVRLSKYNVDEKLLKLAEEVKETGNLRFGTFHLYENDKE